MYVHVSTNHKNNNNSMNLANSVCSFHVLLMTWNKKRMLSRMITGIRETKYIQRIQYSHNKDYNSIILKPERMTCFCGRKLPTIKKKYSPCLCNAIYDSLSPIVL